MTVTLGSTGSEDWDEWAEWEDSAGTWRDRAVERSLRTARAKAETRSERFIGTAIEILRETGRTDFTLQDLVDRSKTSLRSFYQYFSSKDELLLALVEEVTAATVAEWRERSEALEPLEGLKFLVDSVHGPTMQSESAGLSRALATFNMHLAESRPDDYARVLKPLYDALRESLERGAKIGVVRADIDSRRLTTILLQTLVGASQLSALRTAPGKRPPETDLIWDFLLGGIAGTATVATKAKS